VHKVLLTPQKQLYTYKAIIIYCGICCFLLKKSSLGHYNYIFQIVWALLGGTELGLIGDFSIKLSSAQKTVSLVSSKFVRRWRYHIRNWICGVAHTPYASWDHIIIKCNNTWGVSNTPYGSWDSKLGRMGYTLRKQWVKRPPYLVRRQPLLRDLPAVLGKLAHAHRGGGYFN
jgi:hypothetical protein